MNSPMSPQNYLSSELRDMIHERKMLSTKSRMKVLNALNENDQKRIIEKEKRLRLEAIREILTTEMTYLKQLEILMEFFICPMIERNLLNHLLLSTLFDNVKILYNISGELIKELKEDPENIAGTFYKLAPFFKLYSVYAYDYEQILELLQKAQENDPILNNFITQQETRPEVGRKLPSLLITPIQRVPRYKLLLKEVFQHTPSKHQEYTLLQACLVEVEKAAVHINTLVAQSEDTQKLLKLQKCIINPINLIKPGRKLIKQGALMRVSRRKNSAYRRYFILLSDTLLYCKGNPENSLTVCCVLPLSKCNVESVLSSGLFRVTCLDEILLLYSEKGDGNSWIESLKNAINKYTESKQTLRKDSSSRKPLRHNNVNQFPSENILNVSVKRKKLEDEEDVPLNASRIMYFKKENEEEEEEDEGESMNPQEADNCFLLFKKIKKVKSDLIKKKHVRFYENNMNLKLNNTNVNVQLSMTHVRENNTEDTSNISDKMNNCGPGYSFIPDSIQQTSPIFKNISNFISYIGSSVRDIFKFR